MTKSFLLTLLLISCLRVNSQSTEMKSGIGISIPVIWNHSEAIFYQLGSPKYTTGKAVSYGLNIDYSQPLYKGFYGKFGVGYFKQNFGIIRPFKYDSPVYLGYSTDSYQYDNIQLLAGIGYKWHISKVTFFNGSVIFNQYYSTRQKYINASPVPSQINHKSISLGKMVNLEFGVERRISKKISVLTNIIFPVYTDWNKDDMFYYLGYFSDEQQVAKNKFSSGVVVSCNYNF